MRRFSLVNEDNQQYVLQNGTTKVFLWTPAGLGFAYEREYMESDGFFFEMHHAVAQVPKTGVLLFHGKNPYQDYKDLMDFINGSRSLKLAYAPLNTWYYVDIDIESVEKTELETDGTLQCAINMIPKTPLYLLNETNISLSGSLADSIKKYDYKYSVEEFANKYWLYMDAGATVQYLGRSTSYISDGGHQTPTIAGWSGTVTAGDYVYYNGIYYYWGSNAWHNTGLLDIDYSYKYSNTAVAGEIEFEISAQMPSGLEIIVNGAISAPVLTFYADGEQIGVIDLTAVSAQADEYIRYSSIPTEAGIYLYSDGVETDISENIGLNPNYPTFFLLPPNKTIKAVLSAEVLTGANASLKIYEYYLSV